MPELPEVETVRRGLAPALDGRRFLRVDARRPDLRFPFPENFAARLTHATVRALERRGKYLTAPLDTGETLIMHLGMSGRFTLETAAELARPGDFAHARNVDPRHDHVAFHIEGGARITFNDPRRFGFMDIAPAHQALDSWGPFARMGPEPLSPRFTARRLSDALAGRRTPLKSALLDQKTVAGLGNIYVCEALFEAGLSPDRLARDTTAEDVARLTRAIKAVLRRAIEAGGSSLRDYAQADGGLGYFQHAFKVYGRAGEPCLRPGCGGRVIRAVHANRSSFHCPVCQH